MLWDPGSNEKDGEEGNSAVPGTPFLVPLQNKPTTTEKNVPLLVPDVQELKNQFQHQQNMLTQIKETLKQNESQLTSKEKQVEVYANKLSQIRARTKNSNAKKLSTSGNTSQGSSSKALFKKSSKENLSKFEVGGEEESSKSGRRGKVSELKKGLEENKIKFEERTGKEQTETKKIESLVEQLKAQLDERDKTIQHLQKNIEQPVSRLEPLTKKIKLKSDRDLMASKSTQTSQNPPSHESSEIVALKNKIYELEGNVLDLEENLKEKESVIEARTQAVALLSQDLSLKGKNTLENLEETRQEMRIMQSNFVAIEDQLKKDLLEKDNRLAELEEKYKKSQSTNFDLSVKNAELQEKLVNAQKKYTDLESEKKSMELNSTKQELDNSKLEEFENKISVLTKEVDDRNKAMIKMKLEHKNKVKVLNKTIDTLKKSSDDKAEIVRLSKLVEEFESVKTGLENRVAELEDEKGNLLLSVLDVDDLKVTEKKLKDQINELEIIIKKQNEDLNLHLNKISSLEKENLDLLQANQNQNIQIENLYSKMLNVSNEETSKVNELNQKIVRLEAEYNKKIENLKIEHEKKIEMLESYYSSKIENFDRKELEEYRISTEINNIHVEEQIELLIREKQQLLEKLKSLSGVSSTDSLAFEKMEHSEYKEDNKESVCAGESTSNVEIEDESKILQLQKIVSDQQNLISDMQKTIQLEKEKAKVSEQKMKELKEIIKKLEEAKTSKAMDLEESSKSQKSNLNNKNKMKKIEMELAETKKNLEEQNIKMKELNQKLLEKEELIQRYSEQIETFEKDDWDRQNHWQNEGDDIENFQELQKKCLSLENSLIELNEHCEKLRKENIEVVHRLSEEKVRRKKLLEELRAKSETKGENKKDELESAEIESKMTFLNQLLMDLEIKLNRVEVALSNQIVEKTDPGIEACENWENAELQKKFEWTNVVLTSKETEIFRLQNVLEDRCKAIENLESDLKESKANLLKSETNFQKVMESLQAKERQLEDVLCNFAKLQEIANNADIKLKENRTEIQSLSLIIKQREENLRTKEKEVEEIKGVLAQKNLDITDLKSRLEEVNSNLKHSYQEHLDNMGKCLTDKESEYSALLSEKGHLENVNKTLIAEKEEIHRLIDHLKSEKEKLQNLLSEKEAQISDLNEKLQNAENSAHKDEKTSNQEMIDLKTKMKKLAANLKKKAQNEIDLQKQVKDLESSMAEKDKIAQKLQTDLSETTEKWTVEKTEKEQIQNELVETLSEKASFENECISLKDLVKNLEKELESNRLMHEGQVKQLEDEIQKTYKTCNDLQMMEQMYKDKVFELETKFNELSQTHQNTVTTLFKEKEVEFEEERKVLLKNLADISGKYEEIKFTYNELLIEKSEVETKLNELQQSQEGLQFEKLGSDAKLQENLAVIENLESELTRSQDQLKYVEEKLFVSEERRVSLETKNEEMFRKITEDSQNLITIDDLANRVDALLKSEKDLLNSVKTLEAKNLELKQLLNDVQDQKQNLEKEVKGLTEKVTEASEELKQMKDLDAEKSNIINSITKDLDKAKAENKQISIEFKKLNQDYEQFEVDFKENLENSQNLEKSLKHKIEELSSENSALLERINLLSEDKNYSEAKPEETVEDKKKKKRKSVTFRTDEVEYIKDLKKQLHEYDANLKKAKEEIQSLKTELDNFKSKRKIPCGVAEVQETITNTQKSISSEILAPVIEPFVEKTNEKSLFAANSSAGETKFDANLFFGSEPVQFEENSFFSENIKPHPEEPTQGSDFESLVWDDSWGTDGHLEAEYLSNKVAESNAQSKEGIILEYEAKIKSLEEALESSKKEVERLSKDLQDQTAKYSKALKKLKEQKIVCEKLQVEIKQLKSNVGLENLDAAIVDELKSQIENMEKKEREMLKSIENFKADKEALLKKIEVLNVGNEKFLEMKERQDNEAQIWQQKNNDLLKEISTLRQQLSELHIIDDNFLAKENKELLNKIEALEWKNYELTQLLEERDEIMEKKLEPSLDVQKVIEEKSLLQKEVEELNNVKELLQKKLFDEEKKNSSAIGELNEQLNALASENETLQDILGEMKKSTNVLKKENKTESKIFDYFKTSSSGDDLFAVQPNKPSLQSELFKSNEIKLANMNEIEDLKQKIFQLEENLKSKEIDVNDKTQKITELENYLKSKENENLEEKIKNLEESLKTKENDIRQFREVSSSREKELLNLQQKMLQLQTEKETEINDFRKNVSEIENILRLREEELQCLKMLLQRREDELEQRKELEVNQNQTSKQFETIDLNEKTANTVSPHDELNTLKDKILELENLLQLKENEMLQFQSVVSQEKFMEMENLQKKNVELENVLRVTEEELNRLQSLSLNQATSNNEEELKRKIQELEEFLRFKENEYFQFQMVKSNETQELNMRIINMEDLLKTKDTQLENMQQRVYELESISLNGKESPVIPMANVNEIEGLKQKVMELENALALKNDEVKQLMTRINELEKSYNDSKLEIERLLNEEKLNTEEKFVEPFQNNIQIPVAFEVEAITRSLEEEKQKVENLQYESLEKNKIIQQKAEEIEVLTKKISDLENCVKNLEEAGNRERLITSESLEVKTQLEKMAMDLQKELDCTNIQLSETRRELEQYQNAKDEALSDLRSQLKELETELMESTERKDSEIMELKSELNEKTNFYESLLQSKNKDEGKLIERIKELEAFKSLVEKDFEALQIEQSAKEQEASNLILALNNERTQLEQITVVLQEKDREIADLKQTLLHLQDEIGHFRNFEKQMKELRITQLKETSSEVPVTPEGDPDFSDWTEHELAELSTRLQSDLDTALYMLHQRDVRCDELTFELMQLIEERDTLQLRLSTALRLNEELRSLAKSDRNSSSQSLQKSKDIVDQSNDRQDERVVVPGEDLRQLANKISELHSVSYLKDKTVKDDSVQRHTEQMNLLSRISDSDISLNRDAQSSSTVLNWMKGKATPKVMHI